MTSHESASTGSPAPGTGTECEPARYPTATIRAELEETTGAQCPESLRYAKVTIFATVTQPADYPNPWTTPEQPKVQFTTDIATARAIARVINGAVWPEGEPYDDSGLDYDEDGNDEF
jgi:hypothetical protein